MLASIRRRPRLVVGAGVLVVAVAAVLWFAVLKPPGDVQNGHKVTFVAPKPAPPKPKPAGEHFLWPFFGRDLDHTRALDARLGPPYRRAWTYDAGDLVEVQPVLADGRLFMANKKAIIQAVSARTGERLWKRQVGGLSASTPGYSGGRIYVTTLTDNVVCMDARTGHVYWAKTIPSRSESSPIVVGDSVYFGSEDGTVYALRTRDGSKRWTYHSGGAVKGALAYQNGTLYFGDYAGNVTALQLDDGRQVWSTSTSNGALGSSQFYATPTLAFGRIYLGNTDGKMYSFSARTGQLAWTKSTGNYVYAPAVVTNIGGTRPTVYFGSYDSTFYALDARLGTTVWTHPAPGPVSGAATVIGDVVYFSSLHVNQTLGLDVRTGKPVFRFGDGSFNPVISDGKRLYLTGFSHEYALVPR